MEILRILGVAVVLFASTNIDDIFILLSFFSDPQYRAQQVIIGQYLGIAVLVAVSILASLISLVLEPAYVGLLGLLPVALGVKKLFDLRRGGEDIDSEQKKASVGKVLAVASVTAANGGDNIGIYTPVFATSSTPAMVTIVVVFATMVAVWLAFAHWLVHHPALGAPIRRFGHIVTPFVLVAIGLFGLYEADSFLLLG